MCVERYFFEVLWSCSHFKSSSEILSERTGTTRRRPVFVMFKRGWKPYFGRA